MDSEIIARLDAINQRLQAIENLLTAQSPADTKVTKNATPARQMSVAEYVLEKNPTDDTERTLVLASFLEIFREQTNFTADELRRLFIESRLKAPSNVNDKIGKRIQKGHIMPVGERDGKKTWCLTMTGQAVVKEGFGK